MMEYLNLDKGATSPIALCALVLAISLPLLRYFFSYPSFPKNAPKSAAEQYPIIGALKFFSQRYSWYQRQLQKTKTGAFSFHVGNKPVVGLSGENGRKVFYESKALAFGPAYSAMLAGTPTVAKSSNLFKDERIETEDDFSMYFSSRIISLMKGPVLKKGLSQLMDDICGKFDRLAAEDHLAMKPFDTIYDLVYKLTMRTVGCREIADNEALLEETNHYFAIIEKAASPWMIMYSWLPTLGKFTRLYSGTRLYMIFNKIVEERKKTGKDEGDALSFLMNQGDDVTKIITFVLGALFAGQINTGINAAHILCGLATDKVWYDRVREEVDTIANRYNTDQSLTLKEKLRNVPLEAWEKEFVNIDYCLKDTIRITQMGASFRMNSSNNDIPIGHGEVIPPGAYVAWHFADTSYNNQIYPNYEKWDPGRYLPERAEDKSAPYAWTGWGAGRHPCLGMRFAKLEVNTIVAFFIAYFEDWQVVDGVGKSRPPPGLNRESHTAGKPKDEIWLKYKLRN